MTDETETTRAPGEGQQTPADDSRFEVKWRKKNEPSPANAAPGQTEAATATESVADLRRQLEDERRRADELRDRWQRSAADLANLRRRTEQERGEVEQFASMLLVQELLPVLDNFERAIATIPGNLQMLTWIHGVILIERHLRAILERQGLKPIEAQGQPFNAYYHEAIAEKETAEAAPGTVLQEYQRGYTMHGRVIRPTLVEVARAPVAAPAGAEGQAESPQEASSAPPSDSAAEASAPEGVAGTSASDTEAEATDEAQGRQIVEEAGTENVGP